MQFYSVCTETKLS